MVDFRIQVVIDPSRAKTGAASVRGELDRTTKSANALRTALTRAVGILGTGVIIRSGIRTLASFSQEMSTVGAITGATAEEFANLNERAIELGTNTRFTATQAAEGMTFLARAGFSAAQAFETVDDTLQLAQAGALDLGRAADIASNVLTGFRLETDEAARVVDVLALAANSSNTTVGQLGDALKFVAPVAAGVGVSIEETTAAVSALSNAGLQASLAGTGLRKILAELEAPSSKTTEILGALGVRLEEVKVSEVGLTAALQRLADAGVDTGTALEIFGQRGGPAFEVLRTSIPDVERFNTLLEGAEGTAKRVAEAMDDNLNGAILAVKSAYEGLILRLGQAGAEGALRSFFTTLTNVLRGAANNIDTFVNVLEGLGFVLGVTLARKAIPAVITGLKNLAIAFVTNPIGAFTTVVTAAAAAVIAFRDEITLTSDSTTTAADVIRAAWEQLKDVFETFQPLIEELGQTLDNTLGTSFAGLELNFQTVLLAVAATVDASIGILMAFGNSVVNLFTGIGPAIGSAFFVILNGLINLVETGTDHTLAFFKAVGSTAKSTGLALLNFFREIDLALTQLAQGQGGAAAETVAQATDLIGRQLAGVGTTFTRTLQGELQQLEGERFLDELENPFAGKGEELADSLVTGFQEGLDFSGATDFILQAIDTANANRQQAEAAERAATAIQKQADAMKTATPVADQYTMELEEATQETEQLARTTGEGLVSGLNKGLKGMTDVAGAAETLMVNAFGAAEDALVSFVTTGEADFSAFVDGLLADLTRLLARQALLALISSFGGPGAAAAAQGGAFFGGGRAEGGPVNSNQAFLVGEEGPELFVPPGAGNIMTAAETAAAGSGGGGGQTVVQAPPVNVSVVNVTDPDDVVSALDSPGAEQKILNVIARNRSNVKQSLA